LKPRILIALALSVLLHATTAVAGAPRENGRFVNLAGPGDRGDFFGVHLPFFARRVAASFSRPEGAARRLSHDPQALEHNPGITWIGHSTLLVRFDGGTFLTDPIFSDRASPVAFAGPVRAVAPGVRIEELPPVDFATISHDHYDHADSRSIRALAERGVRFVVPLGLGEIVRREGGEATELDWWQSTRIGSLTIHCVPAQHFAGRSLFDRDRRLWAGFVVEGPTRRFYHAGDTGYFDGFAEIARRLGPVDVAAVPIGAYEPLAMMRFVHLTPEEAVRAALDVGANHLVAMHWGTFVLTDEPLDEPPRRFAAEALRLGIAADHAWVLSIGETRTW
jgi:N-acyl-phosphatidylethanolamine-hydrolysing phospholipase D